MTLFKSKLYNLIKIQLLVITLIVLNNCTTYGQCNNFQNTIVVPVAGTTYNCNNPMPPSTDMVCADFNVSFSSGNASFYWGWTIFTGSNSVTTTNGPVNSSQQSQFPNIVCVNVPCNSNIVFFVNAYSNPNGGGSLCSQASATVSTSPFTTLPIVIKYLELHQVNNNFRIDWATTSEINNDYFVIEGSNDANDWFELDRINGHGNSNQERQYSWYIGELNIYNYFRLKQVDYDGGFSYSDILVNNIKSEGKIDLKGNSLSNELHIISSISEENLKFKIFDIAGKNIELPLLKNSKEEVILSTSELNKGLYFIYVNQGGYEKSFKFFIN